MNKKKRQLAHEIYECGGCGAYHPIDWAGDCRNDANRYAGPEDYAERNQVDENNVFIVDAPDT